MLFRTTVPETSVLIICCAIYPQKYHTWMYMYRHMNHMTFMPCSDVLPKLSIAGSGICKSISESRDSRQEPLNIQAK